MQQQPPTYRQAVFYLYMNAEYTLMSWIFWSPFFIIVSLIVNVVLNKDISFVRHIYPWECYIQELCGETICAALSEHA